MVGLVAGALITSVIFGKINQRQFAESYFQDLIEQAYLAKSLHFQRHGEILKDIEGKLPHYVLAINQNPELRDSPDAENALQRVKDFYECSSQKVPDEISKILADLPPDETPACALKN